MKSPKQELLDTLKTMIDAPEELSEEALALLSSTEDIVHGPKTRGEGITPSEIVARYDEARAAAAGDLIGQARQVRGLTTRALGERLRISGPRVSQTQNAGNAVEVQTLARYAAVMGYHLKLSFIPEDGGEEIVAEIKVS